MHKMIIEDIVGKLKDNFSVILITDDKECRGNFIKTVIPNKNRFPVHIKIFDENLGFYQVGNSIKDLKFSILQQEKILCILDRSTLGSVYDTLQELRLMIPSMGLKQTIYIGAFVNKELRQFVYNPKINPQEVVFCYLLNNESLDLDSELISEVKERKLSLDESIVQCDKSYSSESIKSNKSASKDWPINKLNYSVDSVVCDYGVFYRGEEKPLFILNSRSNAELIADILEMDDRHQVYRRQDDGCGGMYD